MDRHTPGFRVDHKLPYMSILPVLKEKGVSGLAAASRKERHCLPS